MRVLPGLSAFSALLTLRVLPGLSAFSALLVLRVLSVFAVFGFAAFFSGLLRFAILPGFAAVFFSVFAIFSVFRFRVGRRRVRDRLADDD